MLTINIKKAQSKCSKLLNVNSKNKRKFQTDDNVEIISGFVYMCLEWVINVHIHTCMYTYRHISDSAAALFDFEECSCKQFGILLQNLTTNAYDLYASQD